MSFELKIHRIRRTLVDDNNDEKTGGGILVSVEFVYTSAWTIFDQTLFSLSLSTQFLCIILLILCKWCVTHLTPSSYFGNQFSKSFDFISENPIFKEMKKKTVYRYKMKSVSKWATKSNRRHDALNFTFSLIMLSMMGIFLNTCVNGKCVYVCVCVNVYASNGRSSLDSMSHSGVAVPRDCQVQRIQK